MAEQIQPGTFHPYHHKLKSNNDSKHDSLLKQYTSQFAKDETSIGTSIPEAISYCHEELPMGERQN